MSRPSVCRNFYWSTKTYKLKLSIAWSEGSLCRVEVLRSENKFKCYYITAKSKGMFEVSGPLFQLIFPSKMLAILGRLEMGQKNRAL